jgi:hypothetical protein
MLFRSIIFTVYLTAFVQSAAILSRESESAARQAPPSLLPIAGNETDPQIRQRRPLYSSGPSGSRSSTHLREDFYAGRREPTKTLIRRAASGRATPAPTGEASADTTVHISSESDFALLLPERDGGVLSVSLWSSCTDNSEDRAHLGSRKRRIRLLHPRIWRWHMQQVSLRWLHSCRSLQNCRGQLIHTGLFTDPLDLDQSK